MGAPAVAANHTRYDVTLVDVSGGKGGVVTFASSKATDFAFFMNADVPLKLVDASGTEARAESTSTSSAACMEIKRKHVVPLKVGTYAVTFGPTTVDKVGVVIEEAEHDH
jgi:hypothetical protein